MATPNLAWSYSAVFVLNPFASGLVIMLTFLGGVVALATGAHYAVDVAVYDASSGGVSVSGSMRDTMQPWLTLLVLRWSLQWLQHATAPKRCSSVHHGLPATLRVG